MRQPARQVVRGTQVREDNLLKSCEQLGVAQQTDFPQSHNQETVNRATLFPIAALEKRFVKEVRRG
jgi:hypothetical protein